MAGDDIPTPNAPDDAKRLDAEREWIVRVAKLEKDFRLPRYMAATAIVLAATVLFRVFTR